MRRAACESLAELGHAETLRALQGEGEIDPILAGAFVVLVASATRS